MLVCNCSMFCCTLNYVNSSFEIALMGEERAGCFAWFVLLESRDWFMALPCGAMSLSDVGDYGTF